MYENIRKAKNLVAVSQEQDAKGVVTKRGRGRPAKPHLRKCTIKIDIQLFEQLFEVAQKQGTSVSCLIGVASKKYLAEIRGL